MSDMAPNQVHTLEPIVLEPAEHLLEVRGLNTHFDTRAGVVKAVDGVSLHVDRGEVLGIVGESGCGKSVTSLSIMGLVQHPGEVVAGEILFNGRDIAKMSEDEVRRLRGEHISLIFQQPGSALNPVQRAGVQIKEVFKLHRDWEADIEEEKVVEMLAKVGIPSPEARVDEYPHQLSGGMRQRVMIAMALSCNPKLLIADEPTTALDVTIQAQILDLIRGLQSDLGMAMLMITHDLGVIAEMSHRVVVMYASKIAEKADVKALFARPRHPYTQGLFRSIPSMVGDRQRLETITGTVPNPLEFPIGCKFHNRCPFAQQHCIDHEPPLREIGPGHEAACWLLDPDGPMYDPDRV
jgi:oligopeptide/dipeptide ABC transporter ATP-binding protein